MLNKDHFTNWFNKKFTFNENGKIIVIGQICQYKSPSDIANIYFKICNDLDIPINWTFKDCEDFINSLNPFKKSLQEKIKKLKKEIKLLKLENDWLKRENKMLKKIGENNVK